MPSAMAPLETTTNEVRSCAATVPARRAKIAASPARVREPILTTTRRARPSEARASAMTLGEQVVERGVEPPGEARRDPGDDRQHAVDERRRGVPLVVDRRRLLD